MAMALQEALQAIEQLSALRVLPLLGLKGLMLYLKEERPHELDEKMKNYLEQFKRDFCDAILEDAPPAFVASRLGAHTGYKRLLEETSTQEGREQLRKESLRGIRNNIEKILAGETVARTTIEHDARVLENVLDLASEFSKRHQNEMLLQYQ